jgi:hypothetical protein
VVLAPVELEAEQHVRIPEVESVPAAQHRQLGDWRRQARLGQQAGEDVLEDAGGADRHGPAALNDRSQPPQARTPNACPAVELGQHRLRREQPGGDAPVECEYEVVRPRGDRQVEQGPQGIDDRDAVTPRGGGGELDPVDVDARRGRAPAANTETVGPGSSSTKPHSQPAD